MSRTGRDKLHEMHPVVCRSNVGRDPLGGMRGCRAYYPLGANCNVSTISALAAIHDPSTRTPTLSQR